MCTCVMHLVRFAGGSNSKNMQGILLIFLQDITGKVPQSFQDSILPVLGKLKLPYDRAM